jgi:uncharacterized short protein YbdD (DUF466 family)
MIRSVRAIVSETWRHGVRIARQIIGVPDYETYIAHLRMHHPEREEPTYREFFAERQNARYKGGAGRCC